MLMIILIIIGVILAGIGFISFIGLYLPLILESVNTVFLHKKRTLPRISDMEESIKENRELLKKVSVFLLIVGLICFFLGVLPKYMPNGPASLFSKNSEDKNEYPDKPENDTLKTVVIEGKTIRFLNQEFQDIEEFENCLESLGRNFSIAIKDDYAVSSVYHKVEELIYDYGIKLEKGSD